MIERVKKNRAELGKLREIKDKRIDEIEHSYNLKKEKLEKANEYLITTLGEFAKSQDDLKETKTQKKYTALSGDIIIKKSKRNFLKPEKKHTDTIESIYPDLVVENTTKKIKWAELKKLLVEQDGKIYDKEAHADLTGLVGIEEKPEEFDVK